MINKLKVFKLTIQLPLSNIQSMVEGLRNGQSQSTPIEPSGLIADLATRDLDARSKTTEELAAEFQTAIEEAGAFSWIGIYRHEDPEDVAPAVEVYLAERAIQTPAARERVVDVVGIFGDLTLSLRPNLSPHLHLISEDIVPQLRQGIESRPVGPGFHSLVAEFSL